MRIGTAIPAMVMAVVIGFASVAWADKDRDKGEVKIKTKKMETSRSDTDQWHRGDWTQERSVTVHSERDYAAPRVVERERVSRGEGSGLAATRQMTGPYRYYFTDAEGKYNYYLDRYGYPYQYGGREVGTPVGVLGYVPPERIGGGPALYYRDERPLSRSIFDGPTGTVR